MRIGTNAHQIPEQFSSPEWKVGGNCSHRWELKSQVRKQREEAGALELASSPGQENSWEAPSAPRVHSSRIGHELYGPVTSSSSHGTVYLELPAVSCSDVGRPMSEPGLAWGEFARRGRNTHFCPGHWAVAL